MPCGFADGRPQMSLDIRTVDPTAMRDGNGN